MEPLLQAFGTGSAQAACLLVSCAWKGLLLVACVALLLRCLPRIMAGVRSAIWTAVLVMVLLLPFLSGLSAAAGTGRPGVVHASAAWALVIAGLWAALSVLRLVQLAASVLRLRAVARAAVPVQACQISEAVVSLLGRVSRGSGPVLLCVSPDVSRPSVVGFSRPRILLPSGLLEELSDGELEHVVLHELEHLRRRDDWTNLVQKLSLALFPLHPALLWIDRRLCVERELACDDSVLHRTGAPKAYAACLARLAEDSLLRRGVSVGLSLAMGLLGFRGRRSELSGRVHRILRSTDGTNARSRGRAAFATAFVLCALLSGALLLARSPRLISFAPPAAVAGKPVAPALVDSLRVASAGQPMAARVVDTRPAALLVSATMARAAMPGLPRQIMSAVAPLPRRHTPLRRVALEQTTQASGSSAAGYIVFTAWRQSIITPHLTLAVAESSTSLQDSQPAYAAVPVRGGWLLIQL